MSRFIKLFEIAIFLAVMGPITTFVMWITLAWLGGATTLAEIWP